MKKLIATDDSWTGFILRVGLAVVMLPHGAQKVLGWFGGAGIEKTLVLFATQMHIPAFLAVLVMAAEFLGSIGLLVGCLARVAAFGITCVMIGAVAMVHWPNGLFMNWTGKQAGEGFEFHILAITIAVAIMIVGAGRWSIDSVLQSLYDKRGQDGGTVRPA
ncbi:MAG TPA: hypothetical protein DCZ75_00870 [Geobacter sp.]|nr:hypothetical protein [Geobacter sp.]